MADHRSPASSWRAAKPSFVRQHSAPLHSCAHYLQPREGRLDTVTFSSECQGLLRAECSRGRDSDSHRPHLDTHSEESLENVYSSEPPNIRGARRVKSALHYRPGMNSLRMNLRDGEPLSPSKLRVQKLKADGQWQLKLSGLRPEEQPFELIEPHPSRVLTPPDETALEPDCEELSSLDAPEADTVRGGGGGAAGGLLTSVLRDPMQALMGYAPLPRDDPEIDPEGHREERPTREGQMRQQLSLVKHEVFALRKMTLKMLQSITFQCLTMSCIIANAVIIGFETDMPELPCWSRIELSFLWIFTLEVALRLFVHGPVGFFCGEGCSEGAGAQQLQARPGFGARRRLASPDSTSDVVWNIFDFTIVSFGCTYQAIIAFEGHTNQPRGTDATLLRVLRLLRLLRLLRVVRVVRFLKQLYLLAYGFLEGALAVFWVGVLAATLIYLCAIVLVRAYHAKSPDEPGYEFFETHFANVPGAMFTLFEIMASPTLGNYREVLSHSPLLAAFIVVFVIFGSFGMNGLLTGVISESIMEKNQARLESMRQERETKRRLLESCCGDLFDEVVGDPEGSMSIEAFRLHQDDIASLLMAAGASVPSEDLENMFKVMDYSDSGMIDKSDFLRGVLELCEDVRAMSIMEIHSQMSRCQLKIERYNVHLEQLVSLAEHHAMVVTQNQPLEFSARGVGAHESATCSTAPPTFSAERSCEGGGASARPAGAESGAESGAGPAGGGGLGAAELAALAALQRRLAAAARGGEAGAAGELAQLGRQLARLVQDNADLVGQCLVAQDGRSAPGWPGHPAGRLPLEKAAACDAGAPRSCRF